MFSKDTEHIIKAENYIDKFYDPNKFVYPHMEKISKLS